MLMSEQTRDRLVKLLRRRRIVELRDLFEALGTRSRMTVFRRLREVGYRTSFTHRGQFWGRRAIRAESPGSAVQ